MIFTKIHLCCSHVDLGDICFDPREDSCPPLQPPPSETFVGETDREPRCSISHFMITGHVLFKVDLRGAGPGEFGSEKRFTHFFDPVTHPTSGCTMRSLVIRRLRFLTISVSLTPNTSPGLMRPHSWEFRLAPSRT